jgi:phospholipid/cholesterol/gamma-HCH transport system substrate-binding protein
VKQALEDGAFFGEVYKNPIASLGDFGKLLTENREAINGFLTNLDALTDDMRAGKGLFGRMIEDEAMGVAGKDLVVIAKELTTNLRDASEQLKSGQGLLGALFYDQGMKQKWSDTLDNLAQLSGDLKSQEGLLGALIYDPSLKERLSNAIDAFGSFVGKLDQGEGALPMLMTDKDFKQQLDTLITDLGAAAADIRTVVADARAGKGTVGKLLTDEALYADLRKTVGVLTRSLEDYREAAPITSFTSVLFAAF